MGLIWKKNHDDYEAQRNENLKALADYFDVEINADENIYPTYFEGMKMPYSIRVDDKKATFDLDLSIENALKVFDFLKTL